MVLPGWDSLESVKAINYSLHVAALVFIALIALSEIMAFVYAERHDTLAELRNSAATFNREQIISETERRYAAEIGNLKNQLADAKNRLAEAESRVEEAARKQASRHLTDGEKRALVDALSQFRGYKVKIFCIAGDAEGKAYAEDFASVFAQAGWDYGGGDGVNESRFDKDPVGIEITLNAAQVAAGKIPRAAETLGRTLSSLGLAVGGFRSPDVPPDTIEIRIGQRPPTQN
jgi:multidrug efflux pump subunit AcrA (membrane-fusion protein)